MVTVKFKHNDMDALKQEVQSYALLHLGLKLVPRLPNDPRPPPPAAPMPQPGTLAPAAIKRRPGRPRKIPIASVIQEAPSVTATEAILAFVTKDQVREAVEKFVAAHTVDKAVDIFAEFGVFHLDEVEATDYAAVFKRFSEGTPSAFVGGI